MSVMGDRSLNIPEPQVLVHYPNDTDGFTHHHRVLLHKIGGGRWVALTPDLELQVHDLSTQSHLVLGRHSVFPPHIADACYVFDEITKNELERQKKLAKTMGAILDDSSAVDVSASHWYVADPSSDRFGKMIPVELVDDIVSLGTHGVLQWDQETEYVRELGDDELISFLGERKEASGDLRTIGDHRDSQGRRYLSFSESIALLRESSFEDWGFKGPRSVLEYLKAILAGPGDVISYHLTWVKSSGVSQGTAVVHEHKCLCEALRLGLTRDLLDVSNLMCFEHLTRRLITLEIAVSRNPGMPDFSGLEIVAESPITCRALRMSQTCQPGSPSGSRRRPTFRNRLACFGRNSLRSPKVVMVMLNPPSDGRRTRRRTKVMVVAGPLAPQGASDPSF